MAIQPRRKHVKCNNFIHQEGLHNIIHIHNNILWNIPYIYSQQNIHGIVSVPHDIVMESNIVMCMKAKNRRRTIERTTQVYYLDHKLKWQTVWNWWGFHIPRTTDGSYTCDPFQFIIRNWDLSKKIAAKETQYGSFQWPRILWGTPICQLLTNHARFYPPLSPSHAFGERGNNPTREYLSSIQHKNFTSM